MKPFDDKFERTGHAARRVVLEKGPHGCYLCRQCLQECPTKSRSFCSKQCSDEWVTWRSPSYMRERVFERDKGICAKCSVDTVWFASYLRTVFHGKSAGDPLVKQWLSCYDIPHSVVWIRNWNGWWDADHILPVMEGGGGACGLGNLRTLCIPCHRQENRELNKKRRERSAAKKAAERHMYGR